MEKPSKILYLDRYLLFYVSFALTITNGAVLVFTGVLTSMLAQTDI